MPQVIKMRILNGNNNVPIQANNGTNVLPLSSSSKRGFSGSMLGRIQFAKSGCGGCGRK